MRAALRLRNPQKGAMLFVVLVFCLVIATVMVYLMNFAYQRTRLVDSVGIKRTRNYYRAQAGIVDAFWRLRVNRVPPGWSGSFNDPAFSPVYYLDTEANAITKTQTPSSTVKVSIGPKNQTAGSSSYGLRSVVSVGLDTA